MPSFARDVPKDIKTTLGRTPTQRTSLEIYSKRFYIESSFRAYVRAHLGRALDPFATRIERVYVRFDDVNGTRGGHDTSCRIVVFLVRDEPVLIEEMGTDAKVAFDVACHRVFRNVKRHIERKAPSLRHQTIRGVEERF